MGKKIILLLIILILLAIGWLYFNPSKRIIGGVRGGPIAPNQSAFKEEYSCLGISRDFCPPWPDYGCDYLCYGIVYGKQCFMETYSAQCLQKRSRDCK